MNHAYWMYLLFFVLGGFFFAPVKSAVLGIVGK